MALAPRPLPIQLPSRKEIALEELKNKFDKKLITLIEYEEKRAEIDSDDDF